MFKILQNSALVRHRLMSKRLSTASTRSAENTSIDHKLFDKILVANRGEIACRVIRTARKLGIKTVALYSNVDGPGSLHAKMADEAYQVGNGPSPSESYLRGEEVLDIAMTTGSQGIHPGYGFLSENSAFATAVGEAGLTFIGPPSSAILAMGSKSHSKTVMENAGVPTTPGYHGKNQDPDYLKHEAVNNVGFPLLIKASMGGGGKGMRKVLNESGFLDALDSCKRESKAAFGDTDVILERYLVHPRHIEVQIMADHYGNVLYLHERDCSLQRRHQKIIEEAPASDLPIEFRALMGEVAVKAAKAVGYTNAGTVEFLVDSQSDNNDFYFCEMNTRLQVEHPVTEIISGIDLVEWQLKISSGLELPIKQQRLVPCIGNAMEARIYAENPAKDFLPVTGNVWHHRPPVPSNLGGNDVRVDTGLEAGKDISVYYDPMVSKLIVHGDTREEARKKLIENLQNYLIAGVPSNIPFLIKCAQHPVFVEAGAINTGFLEEYADDVKLEGGIEPIEQAVCALVASLALEDRPSTDNFNTKRKVGPWSNFAGSWRMSSRLRRLLKPLNRDHTDDVSPEINCFCNHDGSFDISICKDEGSNKYALRGSFGDDDKLEIMLDGSTKKSYTAVSKIDIVAGTVQVNIWPNDLSCLETGAVSMVFEHPLYSMKGRASSSTLPHRGKDRQQVTAPMTGKITRINFKEGEKVDKSDAIIIMEAMKMEHAITASMSGLLSKLNCSVGDVVEDSQVLAILGEEIDDSKIAS